MYCVSCESIVKNIKATLNYIKCRFTGSSFQETEKKKTNIPEGVRQLSLKSMAIAKLPSQANETIHK